MLKSEFIIDESWITQKNNSGTFHLQFLLVQIYLITCVPNRGREDNNPAFLRGSVEFIPLHDDKRANLRDAAASYGDESELQFSRSAVESVPSSMYVVEDQFVPKHHLI